MGGAGPSLTPRFQQQTLRSWIYGRYLVDIDIEMIYIYIIVLAFLDGFIKQLKNWEAPLLLG